MIMLVAIVASAASAEIILDCSDQLVDTACWHCCIEHGLRATGKTDYNTTTRNHNSHWLPGNESDKPEGCTCGGPIEEGVCSAVNFRQGCLDCCVGLKAATASFVEDGYCMCLDRFDQHISGY